MKINVFKASILCLAVIFGLGLFSGPAAACSLSPESLPTTNYDLVKITDSIVLAEAVDFDEKKVTFKILEVLKGDFRQDFLVNEGFINSLEAGRDADFNYLRPTGGSCNAFDYEIKRKFLLFINKHRGGWEISGPAYSRINEMVVDQNSPWIVAVRHYLRIGSLGNYENEKNELGKLQNNARQAKDPKKYPPGLVADIDKYFKSPSPSKSMRDLLALYNSSKEMQTGVIWAFAHGGHPEAAEFFLNLFKNEELPTKYIAPISKYVTLTKNEALLNKLGKNYPLIEKQARWSIMWMLIRTAGEKHSDMMLAALKSADKEEAGRLAEWFVRHPSAEATEIIRNLTAGNYQENWQLAFNLAGLGAVDALNWAEAFMQSTDKDRWMAFYIIALSPLEKADKLAGTVIAGDNPKDLSWLIQGYGDSRNPQRWERLQDIINLKNRDAEVDYWLKITLGDMSEEGDTKAAALLKTINK